MTLAIACPRRSPPILAEAETAPAYPGAVIVYESQPYRDGPDVFLFRDTRGATPICRLSRAGGHWEVLFYRGPSNPGPHRMPSFASAKRGISIYLDRYGDRLIGPLNAWSQAQPQHLYHAENPRPGQPQAEPVQIAKRRARRRGW